MQSIGFVGAGNMAGALINGLLNTGFDTEFINVTDIDIEKCTPFTLRGVSYCKDAYELSEKSDIVFLCAKPQGFDALLPSLFVSDSKIYVSIAAGISISYIAKFLGNNAKIIRVMPNTPLLIGQGSTAISPNSNVSESEYQMVDRIFSKLGITVKLPENLMNEVVCTNGSMPAIVYFLIDSAIKSAQKQGVNEDDARILVSKTFVGAAQMLLQSEQTPDELIKIVASPGGTTEMAIESLKDNNIANSIHEAMAACTKRAYELVK